MEARLILNVAFARASAAPLPALRIGLANDVYLRRQNLDLRPEALLKLRLSCHHQRMTFIRVVPLRL
jgi:hypothetical protein